MSFQDTQPAPLTGGGHDEFMVSDPAEIRRLLKDLADSGETAHLSGPDGGHYSTVLWTVDGDLGRIGFSANASDPQLQSLLEGSEATVVAYLDSVKLQFEVGSLMLVHGSRSSALQTDLPEQLFRFQRRSSYRVRTLPRTSPVAHLRHPSIPDMALGLRVLDVSLTGCALFLPNDVPPLGPGVRLHDVRIELDPSTRFEATVVLCHVTSINPQSDGVRLGCELHQLSGEAQRTLQRYIDQTQKRRRLLTLD
jgi:c-di-GMP-binding flagellar brake protein YcgR